MLTVILGLIVMHLFAIISFTSFRGDFTEDPDNNFNLYCDKLYLCWTSAINGVRFGGGLGEGIL